VRYSPLLAAATASSGSLPVEDQLVDLDDRVVHLAISTLL
jgi:hypothetical protein